MKFRRREARDCNGDIRLLAAASPPDWCGRHTLISRVQALSREGPRESEIQKLVVSALPLPLPSVTEVVLREAWLSTTR